MSSSIAIPKRKTQDQSSNSATSSTASSMTKASAENQKPSSSTSTKTPDRSYFGHDRRPSLLSSSLSKSEHTVINVGDSDSPRLISCIKTSQGFDWNQDLFLPSYAEYDCVDLETRQDPVEDILLTDEEIEAMLPR